MPRRCEREGVNSTLPNCLASIMHSSFNQFLVTRHPDQALALRREMLVTGLFKYMAEIQELEDGYAFKFRRSELLVRRIADYILFEGQYSPQLTFVLSAEPDGGAVWLQVRGTESEKEQIRTAYSTHQMLISPPA
jgi:hypothetical protein